MLKAQTLSGVRRARRATLLASGALASLALPQTAWAQEPTPPVATPVAQPVGVPADLDGNDVIVTARKQSETLQEVPVTVSVVGAKTISDYHIEHVADVASRVPTLNVQVGGSGSGGQISLRGVGSSSISASFDSAVAFDFDGVQVSTMRLVQAGFFDVAQIEVLKGPQSLYFGKSASAGVLSLHSAEPTANWEGSAKASYEFEEQGKVIGGYLSGPLSQTLGVRLAAQYTDISRYQKLQDGTPAVNNPRGLTDFVGRATLNWRPDSTFTANLKFQYVRNTNDGAIANSDIYCGKNGRADEVWLLGGTAVFPAGYNCNTRDGRYFLPDSAPPLAGSVPKPSKAVGFNGVPFGETDLYFGRLRLDWDLSHALRLTSVSGFVDLNAVDVDAYSYGGIGPAFAAVGSLPPALAAVNGPGIPGGVGTSDPLNTLTQYSQEVRLASDFSGPINFMLGGFYENRRFVLDTAQNAANVSLVAPDPVTGYTFDYDKRQVTKTDAWSVFGSLTIKPTDRLELSGGLRYTDEHKSSIISVPYVHAFLEASPAFLKTGFVSGPIKFSDSNLSPEVTIKYKVSDDVNLFGSFKTGFKSGGIDNSALPTNSLLGLGSSDPAVRDAVANGLKYQSEKTKGGEIGLKSQLLDRTVTFNATAYYYVFTDLQVQNFNATTIQYVTLNAGEVTTKGVELESRWRTPLEGLSLSGNLSYLDAKFTDAFVLPGPDGVAGTADDPNLDGRKVARAPRWSGNVAFDYTQSIGDAYSFQLGGNMTFSSRYYAANTGFDDYTQKAYASFDARASFGASDDRWRVAVVGVDLADYLWTNTAGGRPFLAPANPYGVPVGDDIILTQNRGRQIFIEGTVKF